MEEPTQTSTFKGHTLKFSLTWREGKQNKNPISIAISWPNNQEALGQRGLKNLQQEIHDLAHGEDRSRQRDDDNNKLVVAARRGGCCAQLVESQAARGGCQWRCLRGSSALLRRGVEGCLRLCGCKEGRLRIWRLCGCGRDWFSAVLWRRNRGEKRKGRGSGVQVLSGCFGVGGKRWVEPLLRWGEGQVAGHRGGGWLSAGKRREGSGDGRGL